MFGNHDNRKLVKQKYEYVQNTYRYSKQPLTLKFTCLRFKQCLEYWRRRDTFFERIIIIINYNAL